MKKYRKKEAHDFDIRFKDKMISGEMKVETEDGRPVRIICWDAVETMPIVALVDGVAQHYNSEGKNITSRSTRLDLVMIPQPEEKKKVIFIYRAKNPIIRFFEQIFCKHNFVLTDDNYWGYDGYVQLHQYTCTNCGRHDYLHPCDDRNKDWNGGKGDGQICSIFCQE